MDLLRSGHVENQGNLGYVHIYLGQGRVNVRQVQGIFLQRLLWFPHLFCPQLIRTLHFRNMYTARKYLGISRYFMLWSVRFWRVSKLSAFILFKILSLIFILRRIKKHTNIHVYTQTFAFMWSVKAIGPRHNMVQVQTKPFWIT